MIRESGVYAVHESHTFQIAYRDGGFVALRRYDGDPHTGSRVPVAALSRLDRVTTSAEWNDVRVVVERILPSRLAWLRMRDGDLADSLGLYGDARRGWGAMCPIFELDDVREDIEDLLAPER
ncbi:MAG: hypothetical protein WKF79_15055 [Nocardioides sp.]